MFPTILELGPLHIRSYGVLLAVSVVLGVVLAARRASADASGIAADRRVLVVCSEGPVRPLAPPEEPASDI